MKNRVVILVAALLLIAVPIVAQLQSSTGSTLSDAPSAPITTNWGTQSGTFYTLSAWTFAPIDSSVTYAYSITPWGIYRTNGTGSFWLQAPVQLPEGASIEYLQMSICDSTATGGTGVWLQQSSLIGAESDVATFQPTSGAEIPGCVIRGYLLPTPYTVNNAAYQYDLEINLSEASSALVLVGARIGYRLQISPAPLTASYTDVPTSHPFFQYIEALAASGITAGCVASPPQYCPDAPITRGQMAVFISRALGLHWAP